MCLAVLLTGGCGPALPPERPPADTPMDARPLRIVSLDFCADQYVLKLADRSQIAALSRDAQKDFSALREDARGLPQVRASAEDVLALSPDLVVRSYGGGPQARAFFARAGLPIVQIAYADTIAAVAANITRVAEALGQAPRGAAVVAEMTRALHPAHIATDGGAGTGPRTLYLTPGGATTGPGSLVHEMMVAAGLDNFITAPGWHEVPLERLAGDRPGAIVTAFFGQRTVSINSWSATRHPVAARLVDTLPVAGLDGATTACGAWTLAEAVADMRRLAATRMAGP